ncbi:MAG TPA: hypothetical protein VF704_08045 [Allosphingosinicella sp.]|jgi:hypothetical protein
MKYLQFCMYLALLAASCSDFPRDPHGTLDRVRNEGSFRVGLVTVDPSEEVAALLRGISRRARAAPRLIRGDAEPMLDLLEQGELDLVIGRFEKKSPWARLVTIGPPIKRRMQGDVEFRLAPAMRNGENAWIALVEREARDVAPDAR